MRKALFVMMACASFSAADRLRADVTDGSASDEHAILIVFLTMSGDSHQVVRATVAKSPTPLELPRPPSAAFELKLTDAQGTVLATGAFDDPRIQRGVLPPRGEPAGMHTVRQLASVEYVLRIPHSPEARYLILSKVDPAASADRAAAEQVLDLAPFL